MKKALDILNNRLLSLERHIAIFGTGKNKDFDDVINMEIEGVKEAIKELENLDNRSCESCKFATSYLGTDRKWCEAQIKQDGMTTVEKDFYCKRWESKC